MIEAGAKEIPDEIMFEGIEAAHEDQQDHGRLHQQDRRAEIGKPKFTYEHADFDQELFDKIVEATMDEAKAAMDTDDKNVREERWNKLIDHWHELFLERLSRHGQVSGGASPTSSRRRSSRPGCWRATVWTAARATRSVLWPPRSAFCPACTAPACSPAARLRC